jgi:hypothetical protein
VASLDDYKVVRDLSGEFIAEGVGATVAKTVREVVQAVKELGKETATIKEIAEKMGLDKSATSRRVRRGLDGGYLVNLEDKKGRPLKIKIGDSLPGEAGLLPSVAELMEVCAPVQEGVQQLNDEKTEVYPNGCTVAQESEGEETPPSPPR